MMTRDEIENYLEARGRPQADLISVTVQPLPSYPFDYCHIIIRTPGGFCYELLRFHYEVTPGMLELFLSGFRGAIKKGGLDE